MSAAIIPIEREEGASSVCEMDSESLGIFVRDGVIGVAQKLAELNYSRNRSIGSYAKMDFGLAAGFALFSFVAGIVSGLTLGLWVWTGRLHPVARWIVRAVISAVLAAGLLLVLSDV